MLSYLHVEHFATLWYTTIKNCLPGLLRPFLFACRALHLSMISQLALSLDNLVADPAPEAG